MKPQLPITPSKLSCSVHHQLNMYALAASAAGVGMLALSQPLEAKIVYTKIHQVIGPHQDYSLDLNHDGVTDFTFHNQTYGLSTGTGDGSFLAQIAGQTAPGRKCPCRIRLAR